MACLEKRQKPLHRIECLYVASTSVLPGVPKVLLRRSYFPFPPSSMYGTGRLRGRSGRIKNVPGDCCPQSPLAEPTGSVQSWLCASAQHQLSWRHWYSLTYCSKYLSPTGWRPFLFRIQCPFLIHERFTCTKNQMASLSVNTPSMTLGILLSQPSLVNNMTFPSHDLTRQCYFLKIICKA